MHVGPGIDLCLAYDIIIIGFSDVNKSSLIWVTLQQLIILYFNYKPGYQSPQPETLSMDPHVGRINGSTDFWTVMSCNALLLLLPVCYIFIICGDLIFVILVPEAALLLAGACKNHNLWLGPIFWTCAESSFHNLSHLDLSDLTMGIRRVTDLLSVFDLLWGSDSWLKEHGLRRREWIILICRSDTKNSKTHYFLDNQLLTKFGKSLPFNVLKKNSTKI